MKREERILKGQMGNTEKKSDAHVDRAEDVRTKKQKQIKHKEREGEANQKSKNESEKKRT